jgi:nitroimidazol reductase NimA-like FMN-containing flavoprotein (pyridoxamine 5'-phosphate oxidase superfamily)
MAYPRLEVLDREECLSLLSTVKVGRVGLSMKALPVVLPVNFAVLDGDVVFRTVSGTKFFAAVARAVLAFEADRYDPTGACGWSVLVQGASRVVEDPLDVSRLSTSTIDPWAVDGHADRFVRLEMDVISGRRFTRR